MKNYLYLSLFLLLAAAGCSEASEPEDGNVNIAPYYVEADHYVLGFYEPGRIEAEVDHAQQGVRNIYLWGSEAGAAERDETHPVCVHVNSTGADAELYEQLCDRYGDRHKHLFVITGEERRLDRQIGYFYPAYSLVSIEVTAEEAYDAGHPAGASLNDLCRLYSASPRAYIAAGCETLEEDEQADSPLWNTYFLGYGNRHTMRLIDKRLDECVADDFCLMGVGGYRYCWLRMPAREDGTAPALHIRLTDERGKVYEVDVE